MSTIIPLPSGTRTLILLEFESTNEWALIHSHRFEIIALDSAICIFLYVTYFQTKSHHVRSLYLAYEWRNKGHEYILREELRQRFWRQIHKIKVKLKDEIKYSTVGWLTGNPQKAGGVLFY